MKKYNINNIDGIPMVQSYGFRGEFNILVMELLGKSLEELFQSQQKKYSLKIVCMIGIQMIDLLEFVHNKKFIHRDIKPDNFAIGLDNKSHIIYILDFGLSKKYISSKTHQHIKFKTNKKLTGTARYASINALIGCEQSRRDDLEAVGYVLMYFLRGRLPWQGLHVHKGEDRYKKILAKKWRTSAEELCQGFPEEFAKFVNYTRNLEFESEPDYNYLRSLLLKVLEKENHSYDFYYDWTTENPKITDEISIERYMKKNYNVSLAISGDDKKGKEGENKNKENENDFVLDPRIYTVIETMSSNNDTNETRKYSSKEVKTNETGINISIDNNNISNKSIGNNEESLDEKDGKNSNEKKREKKIENA